MGYPSRRESRPLAPRRLTACALSLSLVLQAAAPALAATAPAPRAADSLHSSVAALGWVSASAVLPAPPVAVSQPVRIPAAWPAFDALSQALTRGAGGDELRRAGAAAVAAAPAAGRAEAQAWTKRFATLPAGAASAASLASARAALPALAKAMGLTVAPARDERAPLDRHEAAQRRVAALAQIGRASCRERV